VSVVLWYRFSSAGSDKGTKLKEKRRTERLTSAGRYEGMVDTIVALASFANEAMGLEYFAAARIESF
jgi:hypothetical protein